MDNFSSKIAEYLLKIKAVRLSIQEPFTWSSGLQSPIYCDNRLILSYPEIRTAVKKAFVQMIQEKYPAVQAIAGVATAGISHGALVADEMGLPFIYVRGEAKGHGLQNRIEGQIQTDLNYVVIEDLVSTGASSVDAIQAIQESGTKVLGTVSIFSYGFQQAVEMFAETQTTYSSLTNLETLLQKAVEINYLAPQELSTVLEWQKSPASWRNS